MSIQINGELPLEKVNNWVMVDILIEDEGRLIMCAAFNTARESESDYHEKFYEENKLFEPGTWMAGPTPIVMELLERLQKYTPAPKVLDMACGVGRHTIPVAQQLNQGGIVVGVDLLDSAIDQLKKYAEEYQVADRIEAVTSDVESYEIAKEEYDYMIATGCLEHVSSGESLQQVITHMQAGTRTGGIHLISITSSVQQVDQETGESEEGNIELNIPTEQLLSLLNQYYEGWNIIECKAVAQAIEETKDNKEIELQGNWITFAACKEDPQPHPEVLEQVGKDTNQ